MSLAGWCVKCMAPLSLGDCRPTGSPRICLHRGRGARPYGSVGSVLSTHRGGAFAASHSGSGHPEGVRLGISDTTTSTPPGGPYFLARWAQSKDGGLPPAPGENVYH
jgi:hypothetical protein